MEYQNEEEELRNVSLYFVLFAALLAAVMILSKALHETPKLNAFVSEAALTLMVGMFVGGLICTFLPGFEPKASSSNNENEDGPQYDPYVLAHSLLSFSPNVFFMALLPPIIFNSGYNLRRELFYRHINAILSFACLGTTITACCTAVLLFGVGHMGWMGSFTPTLVGVIYVWGLDSCHGYRQRLSSVSSKTS